MKMMIRRVTKKGNHGNIRFRLQMSIGLRWHVDAVTYTTASTQLPQGQALFPTGNPCKSCVAMLCCV